MWLANQPEYCHSYGYTLYKYLLSHDWPRYPLIYRYNWLA